MRKSSKWRGRLLRWGTPVALVFLVLAGLWYYQFGRGNFHVVTPGEAYRSAQLSEGRLAKYIDAHGIRSVINLRFPNESARWYQRETTLCERLGVEHRSVPLTAFAAPTPEQVSALLTYFETLPRPVLIHCRAGADRAGVASALWKEVIDGASKEEARVQLSFRYGHISWSATGVLDDFFAAWEPSHVSGSTMDVEAPDEAMAESTP